MGERRIPILVLPFLLMVLAVPLWVGYAGARVLWAAHRRLAGYLPVQATVLATSVDPRPSGRGGVSYVPHVRYRYTVRDTTYVSERTTVLDLSSTRGWAEGVAGRFHPGQAVTAYCDPARPEQAFLLPTTGGLPYLLVGFGVLWTGGAAWLGRRWLLCPVRETSEP